MLLFLHRVHTAASSTSQNNLSSNTVNLSSESIKPAKYHCTVADTMKDLPPQQCQNHGWSAQAAAEKMSSTWPSYAFTGDAELADYLGICEGTYEVMSQGYCLIS